MDLNMTGVSPGTKSKYIRVAEWSELEITPVPDFVYKLLFLYILLVCVVAVVFNSLTFVTFWNCPKLRVPINYLLMNLSLIDFLCGLFGGIPPILANATGRFFMGEVVCLLEGTAVGILGVAHLISLGSLSVSRYVLICKPLGIDFGRRHAVIGIAVSWFWAILWNIPPLFWDGYDLEGIGTFCGPSWQKRDLTTRIYFMLYFIFCFVLPFASMCSSHIAILKHIKEISQPVAKSCQKNRYDNSLRRTMLWMMISFLMCWLPYAILAIYVNFSQISQVDQYVASLPALFAKCSFICNPVIYFLFNGKFREHLIEVICNQKGKREQYSQQV